MDLGLFGGTFNPIHLGHLRVAEEVREALGLDRVMFLPARVPPHKELVGLAPSQIRLELVRRAVAGNPFFEVSDLELNRDGPSYSVDTLVEMRGRLRPKDRLWFLVGADAFREIETWHRYEELFRLADVAVMGRPPDRLPLPAPRSIADQFEPSGTGYRHATGREVRFVPVTLLDISSTNIRSALSEGRSIRYLVPEAVLERLGDLTRTQSESPIRRDE